MTPPALVTEEEAWIAEVSASWQAAQTAPDTVTRRRWLARAHRLAPRDALILAALAGVTLQDGDAAGAALLFEQLAEHHPGPTTAGPAWSGLAACRHALGQALLARVALAWALQMNVPVPALADAIAGSGGWCGLLVTGTLVASGRPTVTMDGVPVPLRWRNGRASLPAGWRDATLITCVGPAGVLVGSPLPTALTRLEAFAERTGAAVTGWAWYPADPAYQARLTVEAGGTRRMISPSMPLEGQTGLFRPRAFRIVDKGPVSIRGPDGRHVTGSPVLIPVPLRATRRRSVPVAPAAPVAVVIPAYGGVAYLTACLESVLATVPASVPVHIVDDASPGPALADALAGFGSRIAVTRLPSNLGFPGAANAGIRAAAGYDVVLLNSDTVVPPGWLDRLRQAAYAAPDIASATPLSNDATILSVPSATGANPVPDLAQTLAWDRLAQDCNGTSTADIPTGVGFCQYLRRDALDQVGLLREDAFAQGYGEENDWCWRARRAGRRHVAALGVFVGHVGGQSFGAARAFLLRRNLAVLNALHPGYDAAIAAWVQTDPLGPVRRRMDERRWAEGRQAGAVVLITHSGGGGVDRAVTARCDTLRAAGQRAIVLRPDARPEDRIDVRPETRIDDPLYPNLRYTPAERPVLAALLAGDAVQHVELHHRRGHDPGILDLATLLRVPVDIVVHDYAAFCQRIALVGPIRRYCGEPDVAGCAACVAAQGSLLQEAITMPALLHRSTRDLAAARRVIAPSLDTARRIARHFPDVTADVQPWDSTPPPMARAPPAANPASSGTRIAVIGAIGTEKGYDVLLACVADAAARHLAIEFVVVGTTIDDAALMAAGPAWVTARYAEADGVALIKEQGAALAFLPSIWPETWCYALSTAWAAGLDVAAFDLGAPAERIRQAGRGWVLPLGLPAAAINDALLAASRGARHRTGDQR